MSVNQVVIGLCLLKLWIPLWLLGEAREWAIVVVTPAAT